MRCKRFKENGGNSLMKYEIIGDTSIIIDLHNGYSILAMSRWNKRRKIV